MLTGHKTSPPCNNLIFYFLRTQRAMFDKYLIDTFQFDINVNFIRKHDRKWQAEKHFCYLAYGATYCLRLSDVLPQVRLDALYGAFRKYLYCLHSLRSGLSRPQIRFQPLLQMTQMLMFRGNRALWSALSAREMFIGVITDIRHRNKRYIN
jgi:hypothetical protein